jgi:hypothetical protein
VDALREKQRDEAKGLMD